MSSAEQRSDRYGVGCHSGRKCPYVDEGNVWRLIAERDYLSQWMDEMEKAMEMGQAEIEKKLGSVTLG